MMRLILGVFCLMCSQLFAWIDLDRLIGEQKVITAMKRIEFVDFPGAHNPSLLKNDRGFLITFRYMPNPHQLWTSHIGLAQLNPQFELIGGPWLLNTRAPESKVPSQSEDARIFMCKNRVFVIYNDNVEVAQPGTWDRRDMFLAEMHLTENGYRLSAPLKLHYPKEYQHRLWQKNWAPFAYGNQLLLSYTLNPHVVVYPNLLTGECYSFYESWFPSEWKYGELRGSSQASLVDGEYLAFFHSGTLDYSNASYPYILWHYFMGAYTFTAEPPFEITQMTPTPLVAAGLYRSSNRDKRVVFPGSFVEEGSTIYLPCGLDDSEMWILTLNKEELKKVMKPVR